MGRPFKCPYCGSHDNVAKGLRRTKQLGPRRIRRCRNCRRKFTPRNQAPLTLNGTIKIRRNLRRSTNPAPTTRQADDDPDSNVM